ncbi:MAG TPA: hypothetical protein DCL44_03425 [Elusimicrobia bacterium]|nr:hypothetical protein [Elusimicrobiota bacterium]
MIIKVWITWALLIGVILYEVPVIFAKYQTDKRLWKLVLHSVLLFVFGLMNLQLGIFCLQMQFDMTRPPYAVHKLVPPARHVAPGHKPAAPVKVKKVEKK